MEEIPQERNIEEDAIKIEKWIKKTVRKISAYLIICIIVVLFLNPFVIIDAGERGVVKQFGEVQPTEWKEGFHVRIPIRDVIERVDVKTLKYESDASAASKDMQVTTTKVAVNYHIVPEMSDEIVKTVGMAYESKIIAPAIQEVVKAATAKFQAEELITKRESVKFAIEESLKNKLIERGIVVETVFITNFDFSPEFNAAIEAKVKAQQMALQAENDLLRIEVEARQKITQAKAEAESIKLIEEQLSKSPRYVEYLAVTKWNGELPKVTGGAIPLINIDST